VFVLTQGFQHPLLRGGGEEGAVAGVCFCGRLIKSRNTPLPPLERGIARPSRFLTTILKQEPNVIISILCNGFMMCVAGFCAINTGLGTFLAMIVLMFTALRSAKTADLLA